MLVVMSVGATEEEIEDVRRHIVADGLTPHESRGAERVVIGVVGAVGLRKEQVMGRLPSCRASSPSPPSAARSS